MLHHLPHNSRRLLGCSGCCSSPQLLPLQSPSCSLIDCLTSLSYSLERDKGKARNASDGNTYRLVVTVQLATVNICAALQIRFCKKKLGRLGVDGMQVGRTGQHGYHAQNDLFDTLHWTPALRGLLIHCGIIPWGVQYGYAHVSIRVNCCQ